MVDRKWSELLPELLQGIRSRVLKNSIADYICFGAVCKSWGSVIVEKPRCLPPQVPLIMALSNTKTISSCFYSHDSKKYSRCERKIDGNQNFIGYGHGWMVTEAHKTASLVNPVTGDKIHLPLPTRFWWGTLSLLFGRIISSEELLLFVGRLCPNSKEVMGFNAFQLDQSSRKWSEVKNLGGRTVFISKLSSISLLASNHPGTKPNCIYFLLSRVKKHYKVFSLEDDSIKDFPLDAKLYGEYSWQHIWFTPSLW
ncbi:hypothetical protein GIB67_019365 [Kingdonia uniflora]|uniref:KIB1-4 beta-propeller domain-containing protein n=1 Tax=Kingdonia uniflora TaxID=39325 RepID=A0A7J7M1M9_9MAGN|nr:hypothetical protein GIB67_019365 [Kingdonia uniflora]